jgi:hypothetical protein
MPPNGTSVGRRHGHGHQPRPKSDRALQLSSRKSCGKGSPPGISKEKLVGDDEELEALLNRIVKFDIEKKAAGPSRQPSNILLPRGGRRKRGTRRA